MAVSHEDERIRELLAPLERVDAVTLPKTRGRRTWLTLAVALGVALLVGGGVAFATRIGPFSGISAADRPQRVQDVLDPAVVAELRADEASGGDQIGTHDIASARLVGTLPSGRHVYVLTTSKGRLCVLV